LREVLSRPLLLRSPVQLHLMRHGETVTNAQAMVTGAQDVPLTAAGEEQARRIGSQLDRHYGLALHSTLSRSLRTLALALEAGHIRVDRMRGDPRLNERSLGVLELQPWRPVDEYAHGDLHYAPEGGDSYAEVARRCLSLLLDLDDEVAAARLEKVLISGHMGPMRILLGIVEERSDPIEVLARSFQNTEVVRVPWSRLVLPGFLRGVF
jgi:broad specificity phosphatase PhoE